MMNREDKLSIVKTLVEDLMRETNGKVHFCENHAPLCLTEIENVVDSILGKTQIHLYRKTIQETKCVMLTGEIDFNEYKEVTDKLIENGFFKRSPKQINEKIYDEYCVGDSLYKILIQKSKA